MTSAVSIVGNGAIGGLLKARCDRLNISFNTLTRQESNEPLIVELLNHRKQQFTQCTQTIANGTIGDVVIVPVKAYQVESVLEELGSQLKPETCLVMLHNGMGTKELIQDKIPNQPVILATTSHAAYKISNYHIKETGIGQSQYGWLNPANLNIRTKHNIEQLIHELLQPSVLLADMQTALWKKLAVNAVINPITAVLRVKNGHLKAPGYKQIVETICAEVSSIAAQYGQELSKAELIKNVYQVIDDTAENYSSMYQDIVADRRTEIDNINGYIVSKAKALGQLTPENQKWLNKVRALENSYNKKNPK